MNTVDVRIASRLQKGKDMDKKRAAAYCRVSTASDMQEGSYETQVSYYREYITTHPDMILVDVYGDQGRSGRSMKKRPGLQKLIKDCKAGLIDIILIKSVSRFARNMLECVSLVRKLRDMGVVIYFEKENFNTKDMHCELILSIMATIAEQESISISQNITWSRRHRYRNGMPTEKQCYGYDKIMPGHVWVINEKEGAHVRRAFFMACQGNKLLEIMKELNRMEIEEGIDRVWDNNRIKHLLTNLSYTGDYLTNKSVTIMTENGRKQVLNDGLADQYYIEEHHEGLVSHEVFDMVQELLEKKLLQGQKKYYTEEEQALLDKAALLCSTEFKETEVGYAS